MVMHVNECDFVAACEFVNEEPPPRRESAARPRDPELDRERKEERKDAELDRRDKEAEEKCKAIRESTEMFDSAHPIDGTIVEDYLERRGISPAFIPANHDLRFVQNLAYYGFADADANEVTLLGEFHCMIASVRNVEGEIIGIHRTYLDPKGPHKLHVPGDARRNRAKKIWHKSQGGLIRLGEIGETLAIGEGIETTLSWSRLLIEGHFGDAFVGSSLAAGISIGNMAGGIIGTMPHPTRKSATIPSGEPDPDHPGMIIPPHVRRVIIIGDGDQEKGDKTERFRPETIMRLRAAGARALGQGLEVYVHQSPIGTDWNDILINLGA
jgi:hypothetical protein